MNNKRGDFTDPIILIILIFIFATGLLVFAFIIPTISNGLLAGGLNNTAEGTSAINQLQDFGTFGIQRGFIFLAMGLIISMFVTAILSNFHPAFAFLYFLILIASSLLSIYFSNAFDTIASNPALATIMEEQTLFTFFMNNYLTITIISGVITMIILFSRFKDIPGAGGGNFA